MAKINFDDKIALQVQDSVAEVNKITAENVNDIKDAINDLDTDLATLTDEISDVEEAGVDTYCGTTVPDNSLGKDGDIYILIEE